MSDVLRLALDTNILVYASGLNDQDRLIQSTKVLKALNRHDVVIPAQAMGEFFNALTRKFRRPAMDARDLVTAWQERYDVAIADVSVFSKAFDLAAVHNLQFWDALILATAASAGCRILLSEDMAEGFVYRGCTVINPFATLPHPLLKDVLERS
jgi:predicted nucleic acid-binding protein